MNITRIYDHRRYVFVSESEQGFWSNERGWVFAIADATPFVGTEFFDIRPPITPADDVRVVCIDFVHDV